MRKKKINPLDDPKYNRHALNYRMRDYSFRDIAKKTGWKYEIIEQRLKDVENDVIPLKALFRDYRNMKKRYIIKPDGEVIDYGELSEKLNIALSSAQYRMKQYNKGEMSLEKVLAPVNNSRRYISKLPPEDPDELKRRKENARLLAIESKKIAEQTQKYKEYL